MERLSTFEAAIQEPFLEHPEESAEWRAAVREEIEMFACPECGHITPDHSWVPDENDITRCLKDGCACSGDFSQWLNPTGEDNPAIIRSTLDAIGEALQGLA